MLTLRPQAAGRYLPLGLVALDTSFTSFHFLFLNLRCYHSRFWGGFIVHACVVSLISLQLLLTWFFDTEGFKWQVRRLSWSASCTVSVDSFFPNCFSFHLKWYDHLPFRSCCGQSLKMEDVSLSLSTLPLFTALIVLFTIPVFVMQDEGVEVLPHKEQLASVSNSTCGAEPGTFPGHVLVAALALYCTERWCPGCSASHGRVWSRRGGTLPFQRGQGLQFPSDQGLWAKFHPEHLCGAAVHINNNIETYGERAGMLTAKSRTRGSNLRYCYQKVFVILKYVSLVLLHLIDGFILPDMYPERFWQFSKQENIK